MARNGDEYKRISKVMKIFLGEENKQLQKCTRVQVPFDE